MTDDGKTSPQDEKDAELQRRREELEEELEAYAHRGIVSPNLLKMARWLSRIMWLVLCVLLVVAVWDGWGKVPREERDAALKRAKKGEEERAAAETMFGEAAADLVAARAREAQAKADQEGDQPRQADAAQCAARNQVQRAWAEQAYARHWQALLAKAEPGAHAIDPRSNALALVEQAATAPAAQRFELLRELADHGREATGQAARVMLERENEAARAVAALVLSRIGLPEDLALLETLAGKTKQDGALREIWFARSMLVLSGGSQPASAVKDVFIAEYWLAGVLRGYEAKPVELAKAYREAPPGFKLELLALLCEAATPEQEDLMKSVATSTRPGAERILAVRWLGQRKLARDVLKSLADGGDAVAEEARQTMK